MPTASMTHAPAANNEAGVAHPVPSTLPHTGKRIRRSTLDSLLRQSPAVHTGTTTEPSIELDNPHGIFLGLRVALLFNAGLGLGALVVYEAWTMLAR
jgi:hypothetical protein